MQNRNILNNTAAVRLSSALKCILDNPELNKFSRDYLTKETKESLDRRSVYLEYAKEPWRTVLWCFCSLNSKGSTKSAKTDWINNFNHMAVLLNPAFLNSEFEGNRDKIFCAINLVLRHFAGGRFLTVSDQYYHDQYAEFKKLNLPTISDLVKVVKARELRSIKMFGKINTASHKLFEIYCSNKYQIELINRHFVGLDIMANEVNNLIKSLPSSGINRKYARNIKMDILADNIDGYYAIDSRIQGVLESCDFGKVNIDKDYDQIESFLNALISDDNYLGLVNIDYQGRCQKSRGLSSWELDRLLFALSDSKRNILNVFLQ